MPRTSTGGQRRDPARSATASEINDPAPPARTPSSTVTIRSWRPASAIICGSRGRTTRTSQTVTSLPSAEQDVGGFLGGLDHLADRQEAHRAGLLGLPRPDQAGAEARADLVGADVAGRRAGPADGGRTGQAEGGLQHDRHLLGR